MNRKTVALVVVLLFILLLAVFLLVRTESVDSADGEIKIKTDYCDLYYPDRWEEYLQIENAGNSVKFRADMKEYGVHPLFDIHFDSEEGVFYDRIRAKDGSEAAVSLTLYFVEPDGSWDQESSDILYGMQEDVNYLCAKLPLANPQESMGSTEAQEPAQEYTDVEIVTPYGKVLYSGTWKPYLRLSFAEEPVYTVSFYANVEGQPEQHLFDLLFGTDPNGQYQLSKAEDGTVYSMSMEQFPLELDDSWTEKQSDILYGMLEASAEMVQALPRIRNEESMADLVLVETPYGQLCYPGELKESIRYSAESKDQYTVTFFGRVEGQKEQRLYAVSFGTDVEDAYGTITNEKGKTISVGISYDSFTPDESWTEEQANAIYAMQETANQVLSLLQLKEH